MATRFFLQAFTFTSANDVGVGIEPAFDSAWEITSQTFTADRVMAETIKRSTTIGTLSYNDANANDQDILFKQWISEPLAAQTIAAQTLKFQIRASEVSTARNLFTTIGVRVVSNSGTAVTGTILAVTRDNTELATTLTNRQFSATTSSLAINAGDRLVFEIGTAGDPDVASDHDSSISVGDSSATELPENDTTTAANSPWIEFANDLTFYSATYNEFQQAQATTANSLTYAFDAEGTNRLLVVDVSIYNAALDTTVTSITYAGVNLTQAAQTVKVNGLNSYRSELWYIIAPTTGSNNIIITLSGIASAIGSGAICYNGMAQANVLDTTNTATGTSTTPSATLTTGISDTQIFDCVCAAPTVNISDVGDGQIARWNQEVSNTEMFGGTEGPIITSGSSVTMDYTLTGSVDWSQVIASFKTTISANAGAAATVTAFMRPITGFWGY